MKKAASFLYAIAIILALTGCQEKRANIMPITKGISFGGEVNYYNESFEFLADIKANGDMIIELTAPDTINGLNFCFAGNEVTVKYYDLEYKYELSSMPAGIVCTLLHEIFSDTQRKDAAVISDKDNYYISGDTENCNYKMFLGETGLPIKLDETESGMHVTFKNVIINTPIS